MTNWYTRSPLLGQKNVLFFEPSDYVSSYQLIEAADLVLVYNSSIGLEASIMGAEVICAGRARFTQAGTVTMPESRESFTGAVRAALADPARQAPAEHKRNARRFLYRELNDASLDLSEFLEPYPSMPGMVLFSDFEPERLRKDRTLGRIREGITSGCSFVAGRGR